MTEDSFSSFFPAWTAAIAAAVAALIGSSRIVSIRAREAERNAIIAAIAAATAALFGDARLVHIGIVPSGPARETQFPASPGRY